VVWWRIHAITAAAARSSTLIRCVRATVPLPTGVAWAATRAATASPSAAHRGANRRNARTSCSKLTTYAACARSRRSRSLARRRA
jgi:hypothetical protein